MTNLEILQFEQLKLKVQDKYLETHTPSNNDISKWKGIDIVYFQEELLKNVKGSISEKTFYTYFKTSPVSKLPRIDMLNLLAGYISYNSWFEYKKYNPIDLSTSDSSKVDTAPEEVENSPLPDAETTNTSLEENNPTEINNNNTEQELQPNTTEIVEVVESNDKNTQTLSDHNTENPNLQLKETENQPNNNNNKLFGKKYFWLVISSILAITVIFLVFRDNWMIKEYRYSFIDADRNTPIKDELDVKIVKKDESPILFRVKPNESFIYTTKSKNLTMIVSSPFYRPDTIKRNLENAPESENIELKPNDYAIQLFYYSKSIKDFKKKREQLNNLISDNAVITQVFDNEIYGVETLDKQKYISLVTLPTTSLENLNVIDTQMKNGKIVMIKFKITTDEKSN
ncbi:hypothetical protein [Chryseobacterium sp. T1]